MLIQDLHFNNIKNLSEEISLRNSFSIAGLSGSGKTSFCSMLSDESLRRVVTLLPKSEYRFLFANLLEKQYTFSKISDMPLTFFLGKVNFFSNPRSTVGTHTAILSEIRKKYSEVYHVGTEYFSFNNSALWCPKCRGRGSLGVKVCPMCQGSRYFYKANDYNLYFKNKSVSLPQINQYTFYELNDVKQDIGLSDKAIKLIQTIINLNIGYLDLNRIVSSLSGGERLRLMLAEFLVECKNCLLILDEISSGVDIYTLKNILNEVQLLGMSNQIWLIDHSDVVLKSTDKTIYFGPGSGSDGGKIIPLSPRPTSLNLPINNTQPESFYELNDLEKRNIFIKKLALPKNRLIIVTGESGCGKSTLLNDCFSVAFKNQYKNVDYVLIGQSRNQSVTSKSTVATFLELKKTAVTYGIDTDRYSLKEFLNLHLKLTDKVAKRLQLLLDLDMSYLTLNRSIQSLSSGEFQCIHMVSCLFNNNNKDTILAFDEPSCGLSQNILNKFLQTIRNVLTSTETSIIMVEHNPYLISNADYIIDFGKRIRQKVTSLSCIPNCGDHIDIDALKIKEHLITGNLEHLQGIDFVEKDNKLIFQNAESDFKGGVLKHISQTAQWIYQDFETRQIRPIISLDFEKTIYSHNTYLFELSNYINFITQKYYNENILDFDFYNKKNQCKCCKGIGKIEIFDFNLVIADSSKSIWDGLLKEEIMNELKRYNYSKIKFLFNEIKKLEKIDLEKPYIKMSESEKTIFLYGYWKSSFYDSKKQSRRTWKGIIFLILKYMRESLSHIKQTIKSSCHIIQCPICNGSLIRTQRQYLIGDKDIRELLKESISSNYHLLKDIEFTDDMIAVTGDKVCLLQDVSDLSRDQQVTLKVLELKYANLFGFEIVLNNVLPFFDKIKHHLNKISEKNRIVICDYPNIMVTKFEILDKYFSNGKLNENSYVYELAKFFKVATEINRKKKNVPCPYCKGKGVIRETGLFEGVDTTEMKCSTCHGTGINIANMDELVFGYPLSIWLKGRLKDLNTLESEDQILLNLPLMSKIKDLDKRELFAVTDFIKKNFQ